MIIKTQKPMEFNSPPEVIYDVRDLKKAILWYSDKPVCRLKNVYLHGRYYAVSIYEEKIHIHRLLMMYWIKSDIPTNQCVHHKNGNRYDNRKENLELIDVSDHASNHNSGKTLTEQHKKKIALANRRRRGVKLKRKYQFKEDELIDIHRGEQTRNSVAEKYGCDWETVDRHYREFIHENPDLLCANTQGN
jgi:hypothetical protein